MQGTSRGCREKTTGEWGKATAAANTTAGLPDRCKQSSNSGDSVETRAANRRRIRQTGKSNLRLRLSLKSFFSSSSPRTSLRAYQVLHARRQGQSESTPRPVSGVPYVAATLPGPCPSVTICSPVARSVCPLTALPVKRKSNLIKRPTANCAFADD